ncbi:hypothetical protein GCM10025883_16550 [Mobilicoccus caccae]|uniref:Major facilitator superfamily (MFS) profile domain-containing protein n=1 Tax=Mobilicoccus caccae TaxID=1859295 RepID=A0ABQ6INY6_9MICO|nr:hypothetical protein GCM10025883_16550 [Mobilicoccus caccae]
MALAPSPWILAVGAVLSGSAAGWVWAPYSDIVSRTAARRHQPVLLAVITTGTSLGLIALAGVALVGLSSSWRVTWAGIASAAALAAAVNLRAVPALKPHDDDRGPTQTRSPWRRAMVPPLVYAVLYFAAITVYFTYASESVRLGGNTASATSLLFALIGLGGLAGLGTARMTRAAGTAKVGVASVWVVSLALVLLGLGRSSIAVILASAVLLGIGYMVGSARTRTAWTAAHSDPLVLTSSFRR